MRGVGVTRADAWGRHQGVDSTAPTL